MDHGHKLCCKYQAYLLASGMLMTQPPIIPPLLCHILLNLNRRYHLEIIKSLAAMCSEVFQGGAVQYAFTTIPTYPRCRKW